MVAVKTIKPHKGATLAREGVAIHARLIGGVGDAFFKAGTGGAGAARGTMSVNLQYKIVMYLLAI
jgi:hypothetical protein